MAMISFEQWLKESRDVKELGHMQFDCIDVPEVFDKWKYSTAGRSRLSSSKIKPLQWIAKKYKISCDALKQQNVKPKEWHHLFVTYTKNNRSYKAVRVNFYDENDFNIELAKQEFSKAV